MKYVFVAVLFIIAILVAIPCFMVTKRLIGDISIMIKGKRYIGTCTSKSGIKNSVHRVEWTDSDGVKNIGLFSVTTLRKTPFQLKVYSVDNDPNKANLGFRSLGYYAVIVILFDFTFFALVLGAIPEILSYI